MLHRTSSLFILYHRKWLKNASVNNLFSQFIFTYVAMKQKFVFTAGKKYNSKLFIVLTYPLVSYELELQVDCYQIFILWQAHGGVIFKGWLINSNIKLYLNLKYVILSNFSFFVHIKSQFLVNYQ